MQPRENRSSREIGKNAEQQSTSHRFKPYSRPERSELPITSTEESRIKALAAQSGAYGTEGWDASSSSQSTRRSVLMPHGEGYWAKNMRIHMENHYRSGGRGSNEIVCQQIYDSLNPHQKRAYDQEMYGVKILTPSQILTPSPRRPEEDTAAKRFEREAKQASKAKFVNQVRAEILKPLPKFGEIDVDKQIKSGMDKFDREARKREQQAYTQTDTASTMRSDVPSSSRSTDKGKVRATEAEIEADEEKD